MTRCCWGREEGKVNIKSYNYFIVKVKEIQMTKKGLLMLVLAVVIAGGVFAQNFATMPKNTVTVDVGPTIFGFAFGQTGKIVGSIPALENFPEIKSSGFGIAAQYERQVLSKLSVAARGAYLGVGIDGFNMGDTVQISGINVDTSINLDLDLTAISAEGHVRFYPFTGTFFVGGMLGYGNMTVGAKGTVVASNAGLGSISQPVNLSAPRNYAKLGARLGWRIDFGNPGGFVFEPSFGYDHAIGLGDSFVTQLIGAVPGDIRDLSDLEQAFNIIESYVFAGGPRLTLGFGWRF